MSAGPFEISKYESTKTGQVHPIRIQTETKALSFGQGRTNTPPAAAINSPISAQVSQGTRSLGLNARMVTITWVGAPPTGYKAGGTITLPWLSEAGFDDLSKGLEGTYLETACKVVGVREEKAN